MRRTPHALLLAALMLVGTLSAQAQLTLTEESRFWIDGTSSVNSFTCESRAADGYGVLAGRNDVSQAKVEVVLPVVSFDCGRQRMNEDFYNALEMKQHPTIRYLLDTAEVITSQSDRYTLRTTGRLTIAGEQQSVVLDVQAQRLPGGRFRAEGSKAMRMSDFGIEPPTAMLGLIKAHDRIVVRFDLIAQPLEMHATE